MTDVFLTTKVPSTKSSSGGDGALGDIALENPIAYAINYILYDLIELGWLSTSIVKSSFNNFNWDNNATYKESVGTINQNVITILQNVAKHINREDPTKTSPQSKDQSIDCILLHHQPDNSDNCKGIFLGFVIAMHCNLVKTYGISNTDDDSVIQDIQQNGKFVDNENNDINDLNNKLKNTNIVIQPQNSNKDSNIASNFNNINIDAVQNVMTGCHDKDCTKSLTNNKNVLVIGGSAIPSKSQKYVEGDLKMFYNIKNNKDPPEINVSDDKVWYYSDNDNKCVSISTDLVYLNENSYFKSEDSCNEVNNIDNSCTFNLNYKNNCDGDKMCWNIDNIDSSSFDQTGKCITGNIDNINITPYNSTRANTRQNREDFNNLDLYNNGELDDNYWKNLGFFKNPGDMVM